MNETNKNVENLYQYLHEKEKETVDYSQFSQALQKSENRKLLYDYLKQDQPQMISYSEFEKGLTEVPQTIERAREMADRLGQSAERESFYMNEARRSLVPPMDEERKRRLYALSPRGIEEETKDYYRTEVAPLYSAERAKAEAEGHSTAGAYMAVPGGDPLTALGAMQRVADPRVVEQRTMEQLDGEKLKQASDAMARYGGLESEAYRRLVYEPALRERMRGESVELETPKTGAEYVARSIAENSLTGKLINLSLSGHAQTDSWPQMKEAQLANYNANEWEDFSAGVGSLLVDGALFAGLGGASTQLTGRATSLLTSRLAARVMARHIGKGMTGEVAQQVVKRAITRKLGNRIAQGAAVQGMTLGGYDVSNSVVDDLLYNERVDGSKALLSYGKGMATGALLGGVGIPLRHLSRNLKGAASFAAQGGVLSAESAVFTLGTQAEKMVQGMDIEPIDLLYDFGRSAATLLSMRMAHWVPKGMEEKFNKDGSVKEALRLSQKEKEEVKEMGVDADAFYESIEEAYMKKDKGEGKDNTRERMAESYVKLMSSDDLSASTRAKLVCLVENKLTTTPPLVTDVKIRRGEEGYSVSLKDIQGRKVSEKTFENKEELYSFIAKNRDEYRNNHIYMNERLFAMDAETRGYFSAAKDYAKENNLSVDYLAELMYRKANRQPITPSMENVLNEIMGKTRELEGENRDYLLDLKGRIEKEHGLSSGDLERALTMKLDECNGEEKSAVLAYEKELSLLNERMRNGFDLNELTLLSEYDEREAVPEKMESVRWRKGEEKIENEEVRDRVEKEMNEEALSEGEEPFPPLAPNTEGLPSGAFSHSPKRLREMASQARSLSKKLHSEVHFIYDIREVSLEDERYSEKVFSSGWYEPSTGEVMLVLPNIRNSEEVNKTVLHEVVGHKGFYELFGKDYARFLKELYLRSNSSIRSDVQQLRKKYRWSTEMATDEYLARLSEREKLNDSDRTMLQRLRNFLTDMFSRMGIRIGKEFNERRLLELLRKHRQSIENGSSIEERRKSLFGSFLKEERGGEKASSPDVAFSEKGGRDKGKKETRYRFIGEKGLKNLMRFGDTYRQMNTLSEAKALEELHVGEAMIKMQTGWERGADGKWRYEINDKDVEVIDYPFVQLKRKRPMVASHFNYLRHKPVSQLDYYDKKELAQIEALMDVEGSEAKLSQLIRDERLLDAYPSLNDVPVVFISKMNRNAYYDVKKRILLLNKSKLTTPELRAELLGEMQRMIQQEENFTKDFQLWENAPLNLLKEAATNHRLATGILSMKKGKSDNKMLALYWEEEFKKKMGMSPEEYRRNYPTPEEYMLHKLLHKNLSISGSVEKRNVISRRDLSEVNRAFSTARSTEDFPREKQKRVENEEEWRQLVDGPIDIWKRKHLEEEK